MTAPTKVRMRSSAWVFGSSVFKALLSVPTGILLARVLGAAGKGSVTVVQTTASLAVALLNLGMPNAVMWLSAKGRSTGRSATAMGAIFSVLSISLVGTVALIVGPDVIADRIGLSGGAMIALALIAMAPSMVGYFVDSHLIGRGAMKLMSLVDVAMLGSQLVLMALLALLHRLTPVTAIIAWLSVISVAVLFKTARALRSDADARRSVSDLWREGRAFGAKSWLANTVNMMSLRQDMLLLAMFSGVRAVGVYSIAVSAAELTWYLPYALQSVATVKFSAEGDDTGLVERMNRSVWPITAVFALAVFALAAPLIPLVYGGVFKASVLPLLLLLPGVIAMSMSISLSAWLTGQGHPQEAALANGVNMVVNLIANVALLRVLHMGAAGAAIASSLSYSVGTAIIVWRFHERSGARLADTLVPRWEDVRATSTSALRAVRERIGVSGGNR